MRDGLGNLEREAEAGRRLVAPALDQLAAGGAVERAVHFNHGVALGIEGEPFPGRQPLGIEHARPVLIRPTTGAETNGVHEMILVASACCTLTWAGCRCRSKSPISVLPAKMRTRRRPTGQATTPETASQSSCGLN